MSWLQIRFTTTPEHQEHLEDALLAAGALSITYEDAADQPILEPGLYETPLWNNLTITALFQADIDVPATLLQTTKRFGKPLPVHKVEILEDKDWIREWMDSYKPLQMGKRLWICPSWCDAPDKDAVNLLLDPGLAFGTGTHPTTAMCLQQLDKMDLNDKTVIDYGCGSGILAIAALLLGAKSATGIDIDLQAIIASRDNAQRNNIAAERFQVLLTGKEPADKADIMLANILAGPLVELAPKLSALTADHGFIVLSGILKEQKEAIIAAYHQFDLQIATLDEWACLFGHKH
jgi:ribosomal protein L11 methyltransferase